MEPGFDDASRILDLAAAILIGALVGIEREKRKADEDATATSGIRTFVLIAMVGGLAAWMSEALLSPWPFAAGLVALAGCIVAGYVAEKSVNPKALGLTSEIAALAVYLLAGTAAVGQREVALALAIVAAAIMSYKDEIHRAIGRLGRNDLNAGLRLLVATFVVLPLLPDMTIDPWGAVNPHSAWLLVVLVSSLSLVGYVAMRWLGAERGLIATGVTGSLVSSTAVTLAFARQSREEDSKGLGNALAAGALAGWTVMFARIGVTAAIVHAQLLGELGIPLLAMAVTTAAMAAFFFVRGRGESRRETAEELEIKNPFSLTSAAKFALLFVAILVLVKVVQQELPQGGVYVVALLAGTTDVDAITLSMAGAARDGGPLAVSTTAIVLALLSNTIVKCGMAVVLGGAALRSRLLVATLLLLAVGGASLAASM